VCGRQKKDEEREREGGGEGEIDKIQS